MILEFVEVNNFRNLNGKIFWGPGLNIIHGNNGQGKTNWIEAIHTLSRTKSFRTQRLQESNQIRTANSIHCRPGFNRQDVHRDLEVTLKENTKAIWVNGKREPTRAIPWAAAGVCLYADQLEVVRGAAEARRHFIDRGIASLRPAYLQTVSRLQTNS